MNGSVGNTAGNGAFVPPVPTGGGTQADKWVMPALTRHYRVIGALILRTAQTRFGHTSVGYLWALIEPIAHVAVMSVVYWAINRQDPVGGNVLLFFVTGVLPFFLFQKTALHVGAALRSNQMLLRFPLIHALDIVTSRGLLEGVTWLAVSVLILGGMIMGDYAPVPEYPMECVGAIILIFTMGMGVGLINAVLGKMWRSWVMLYPIITRPLYHFSAIFFFIDRVPVDLRRWLLWNPMLHGVALFRAGYLSDYDTIYMSPLYLSQWAIGSVVVGLCLQRITRKRIISA